jgi:hypothetical protein
VISTECPSGSNRMSGNAKPSRKRRSRIVPERPASNNHHARASPGASFRGLHDSLVNYGENDPPMLLCNHEKIAVQIAHGYARATGLPMIAIVHDVVGLLHAPMGIYYACLDRAPVFLSPEFSYARWRSCADHCSCGRTDWNNSRRHRRRPMEKEHPELIARRLVDWADMRAGECGGRCRLRHRRAGACRNWLGEARSACRRGGSRDENLERWLLNFCFRSQSGQSERLQSTSAIAPKRNFWTHARAKCFRLRRRY